MCKAVIKGGIVGGIIAFIWYSFSWMFLPWHTTTLGAFKSESAVAQAINVNTPASGMYFMPMMQKGAATTAGVPQVFAAVRLEGATSMVSATVTELVIQIITAILVTWLLTKTSGLSYWRRVGFILVFAVAAGIFGNLPYWNWFGFSVNYTLVQLADAIIAWFLAGLAIAKICNNS